MTLGTESGTSWQQVFVITILVIAALVAVWLKADNLASTLAGGALGYALQGRRVDAGTPPPAGQG